MPHNIRITVDFPEPFGPRKPKMEPLAMEKLTRSTAMKRPKRFVRPLHSIIGSAEPGAFVGMRYSVNQSLSPSFLGQFQAYCGKWLRTLALFSPRGT